MPCFTGSVPQSHADATCGSAAADPAARSLARTFARISSAGAFPFSLASSLLASQHHPRLCDGSQVDSMHVQPRTGCLRCPMPIRAIRAAGVVRRDLAWARLS
jgi:hypothetical protein